MRRKRNLPLLVVTIIGTMIIGGFIGDLLKNYFAIFKYNYPISILSSQGNPWNIINLNVLKLSFSMLININLGSVIGMILGFIVFYKR